MMIPRECYEHPCVGTPGVDMMLVFKFIVIMALGSFGAYNLIVGVLKFNDWRTQWRRR